MGTAADEQVILEKLAVLTERHGPLAAARMMFATRAPTASAPVASPPVEVLVPRSVHGQRALIAARSRRRRHRALALIGRLWSQ